MKKVAIIVPYYKNALSPLEQISKDRIHNVLRAYDIVYVLPKSLPFDNINNVIEQRYEDKYFSSVNAYSSLLLSPDFYQRFKEYHYILICQLDVFIFSNRLEEFCNLGYDYIGAPWLQGILPRVINGEPAKACYVGNGGLSLRNVEKTINLLNEYKTYATQFTGNEDLFFSYFSSNEKYRMPPVEIALDFSIETQVRKCMKLNKWKLPFGCHAWARYDLLFWKPYIEKFGYKIDNIYILSGREDELNKNLYIRSKLMASSSLLRNMRDRLRLIYKFLYGGVHG